MQTPLPSLHGKRVLSLLEHDELEPVFEGETTRKLWAQTVEGVVVAVVVLFQLIGESTKIRVFAAAIFYASLITSRYRHTCHFRSCDS
jgi:hypothetical protein